MSSSSPPWRSSHWRRSAPSLRADNDAAIALAQRVSGSVREIVGTRYAQRRYPSRKRRKLYFANNNTLMRRGYGGLTGVKTGYTDAAGSCLVATVRRGGRHLGVVLLDSPDTGEQGGRLLDEAFRRVVR